MSYFQVSTVQALQDLVRPVGDELVPGVEMIHLDDPSVRGVLIGLYPADDKTVIAILWSRRPVYTIGARHLLRGTVTFKDIDMGPGILGRLAIKALDTYIWLAKTFQR